MGLAVYLLKRGMETRLRRLVADPLRCRVCGRTIRTGTWVVSKRGARYRYLYHRSCAIRIHLIAA